MAQEQGWDVIDVHSAHASHAIVRQLAKATQQSVEHTVAPSGLGISVGGISTTKTKSYDELDLTSLLLDRCRKLPEGRGLFISIDEVQKIKESDMENVCAAFQMSLRKGMPVMLVMDGLPESKQKIASYEGCTFMQRSQEIELGSLLVDETIDAFGQMLQHAKGTTHTIDTVLALSQKSKGHPYLMQLLGYHLVELAAERHANEPVPLEENLVYEALPIAYGAFCTNVLEPSLSHLGSKLRDYLTAMSHLLDEDRKASTTAIAAWLSMSTQQASSYRQRLIQRRLIEPASWGYVRFCLPYLDQYLTQKSDLVPRDENRWVN